MVQYRHLSASGGTHFDGQGFRESESTFIIVASAESFIATHKRSVGELGVNHRLIRDTYNTFGLTLLDYVNRWTRNPSFLELGLTYEQFLLETIGILNPSVLADARGGYANPTLSRRQFEYNREQAGRPGV